MWLTGTSSTTECHENASEWVLETARLGRGWLCLECVAINIRVRSAEQQMRVRLKLMCAHFPKLRTELVREEQVSLNLAR